MRIEEREGYGEDASVEAGDPAQVFDALRQTVEKQGAQLGAEMTVIRRGLEAAFDQFEKFGQPADYSPDLGRIAKELANVSQRLGVIEKHPALLTTPAAQAQAIEQIGTRMVRDTVSNLNQAIRTSAEERGQLARIIGMSREKAEQRKWLIWTAAAGLLAGLALFPLLGNILPIAIGSRMAAITVGEDRWNAGMDMMAADSPGGWGFLQSAWLLANNNREALNACRQEVYQTGETQSCTVSVGPGPGS
ncbi:MAG TPA: hypothetical protein ENH55_13640 [Aurantimonas coralicida]|jgi:hypothetical protein|uniref:Uncharacterized protein n=2 Tax=root TaxID=1 RepID=A0A9C9NIR0_9HYPH|nr:DUF6118 family protein [Jiella pacifica]MAU43304.1 hypothetical protein [Salipiger sp.]HDZ73777.1 hypothetical protein [Aurantimonas coralicida]HEU02219.1 hypothetical protein [Aurantimonas coralicida]